MLKKKIEPQTLLFPTPVVLVTTVDPKGNPNIITVICAGIVCAKPPLIAIGIHPFTYSYSLLKLAGEFVINIPPERLLDAVKYCGRVSGRDEDKFAGAKLTPVPASEVKPPLIKECHVNLECKVKHFLSLGIHDLFIGEVVATHVDEEVIDNKGQLNVERCSPMACAKGASRYWSLSILE